MREQANVWLRSRRPRASTRIPGQVVERTGNATGYADIVHAGRRFRYSHSQHLLGESAGARELWLVFDDQGAAGQD